MDEQALLEKLRRIEALHAGTTSDGEREAARLASERIKARLSELRSKEPDVEFAYSLPDPWARTLFIALCRRYELTPFRRPRQRRSTVLVKAPRSFQERTLWPEFQELSRELRIHLAEVTDRIVKAAVHGDVSDAEGGNLKELGPGEVDEGG